MKIITILGSPRKKGNTAKVLSMFEDKIGKEVSGNIKWTRFSRIK